MPYLSLDQINSNPIFAPCDENMKEDFFRRINANNCASVIKSFFTNPCTLTGKILNGCSSSGGGRKLKLTKEEYNKLHFYENERYETRRFPLEFEYLLTPENIKKKSLQGLNPDCLLDMLKERDERNIIHSNGVKNICDLFYRVEKKERWVKRNNEQKNEVTGYYINFELRFSTYIPRGFTEDDVNKHNQSMKNLKNTISSYGLFIKNIPRDADCLEHLKNALWCFNIIQKEFKLLQESKRDFYRKYFTTKPFTAFEECGIEVFYARKGYAIDGKRLPNFNRGSVYGLKNSLKLNNIKLKDVGSKKDDLIKYLMKL